MIVYVCTPREIFSWPAWRGPFSSTCHMHTTCCLAELFARWCSEDPTAEDVESTTSRSQHWTMWHHVTLYTIIYYFNDITMYLHDFKCIQKWFSVHVLPQFASTTCYVYLFVRSAFSYANGDEPSPLAERSLVAVWGFFRNGGGPQRLRFYRESDDKRLEFWDTGTPISRLVVMNANMCCAQAEMLRKPPNTAQLQHQATRKSQDISQELLWIDVDVAKGVFIGLVVGAQVGLFVASSIGAEFCAGLGSGATVKPDVYRNSNRPTAVTFFVMHLQNWSTFYNIPSRFFEDTILHVSWGQCHYEEPSWNRENIMQVNGPAWSAPATMVTSVHWNLCYLYQNWFLQPNEIHQHLIPSRTRSTGCTLFSTMLRWSWTLWWTLCCKAQRERTDRQTDEWTYRWPTEKLHELWSKGNTTVRDFMWLLVVTLFNWAVRIVSAPASLTFPERKKS